MGLRRVSPRVSLHPSLLLYDVVADDGANAGHNHDGTIGTLDVELDDHAGGHAEVVVRRHGSGHGERNWREYWWYADEELAPASHADGPGRACHLPDMADVRNHRHHGLIGALVVEPGDCSPSTRSRDPSTTSCSERGKRATTRTAAASSGGPWNTACGGCCGSRSERVARLSAHDRQLLHGTGVFGQETTYASWWPEGNKTTGENPSTPMPSTVAITRGKPGYDDAD